MHTSSISIIILAAGASRRLGRPKQLVRFRGETLLRRTARLALATGCRPVVAVLGADAAALAPELADLEIDMVVNAAWEEGMGSSLRTGLNRALAIVPDVEALLFLVVDQPYLTAAHLKQLLSTYQEKGAPIVASVYDGRPGVPALFDRSLFPELAEMEGDQGARVLFRRYQDRLAVVDFPAGRFDLDTPEDIGRLRTEETDPGGL